MILSGITPEKGLVTILSGHITVGRTSKPVPVFGHGDVPTTNNTEDFVIVERNGTAKSFAHDFSCMDGYLIISYYTKLNANGTIRQNRIDKILDQIETLCGDCTDSKYFYGLDRNNPVTPPTAKQDVGFSYVRINIHWHTK